MRILTRGDMDGLASAVLMTVVEDIGEIRFAHPKDVQDGLVPCDEQDIVTNMPFVPGCGLWFDHHVSEDRKLDDIGEFKGRFECAPSAARVIYNHYKSDKFDEFKEMLEATDRLDAATLTVEEVTNPKGWILLGLTLDPRSGLGPEFRKYFRWLVEYVKEIPLEKVLQHSEVKKRTDRVLTEQEEFKTLLKEHSHQEGNVIITDFRGVKDVPVGNRFLVYTLYPDANVEARFISGKDGRVVIAAGHSIFNRTCNVNIGELCSRYGGGGHKGAGTVQLDANEAEAKGAEILKILKENKPI
ncbi:exopolyphosphatase [Planctomycetota bacterium]